MDLNLSDEQSRKLWDFFDDMDRNSKRFREAGFSEDDADALAQLYLECDEKMVEQYSFTRSDLESILARPDNRPLRSKITTGLTQFREMLDAPFVIEAEESLMNVAHQMRKYRKRMDGIQNS
jgi:hypothetical protein